MNAPADANLGTDLPPLGIVRSEVVLRPDPRRVVVRPFLPDKHIFPDGGLLNRILAMTEEQVASTLAAAYAKFDDRHRNLAEVLEDHFDFVAAEAWESDHLDAVSKDRQLLIGAYYTEEFAIEAAALTNPSMVPAPDQTGLETGTERFVLSLRAIGEGQTSSIEFRSGVIDARGAITIETPTRLAVTGKRTCTVFDKAVFCAKLSEMKAFGPMAKAVINPLPDRFDLRQLEDAIAEVEGKRAPHRLSDPTTRAIHWLATSNYDLVFPADTSLSERVIFAGSETESHGLEDARFVRFTDDEGIVTYYATYTAFDGVRVLPQLIETTDFASFRVITLSGVCSQNKGAALFPRKIDGHFVALSRFDTENNYVMRTDNLRIWSSAEKIESPQFPWDLARIGNCGSPLETDAGWLVITHGVGPFRTYSLGAILLEIDDPTKVIGRLAEPLLAPMEDERDGYVPNVVYSCGSMIHGDQLILPYGHADMTTRIATIPLDALLQRLSAGNR